MNSSRSVILQGEGLGELLVGAKIITNEQLQQVLALSRTDGRKIGHILKEQDLITAQQLALFTGLQFNVPFINLKRQSVHPKALDSIPEAIARRYGVIPLEVVNGAIMLVMEDPGDIEIIETISALTRKRVEPVVGIPSDIREAIDRNYRAGLEINKQLDQLPIHRESQDVSETRISADAIAQAPIVRAIDLLIRQAIKDRASDIHIEPQEDKLRVRNRIDGILQEALILPLSVHPALISRLKIMAGMNIAERRRPQDGQISFPIEDREIDIRVATSNTVNGEMVVLRVLDKSFAFLTLPELGFLSEGLGKYQNILKTPFGMVLISGPTGSGKTTTLYASVNQLDSVGRKFITIEDPVEYHFSSINQMQVNPQLNITFASGLRACMRLDPDVILVGEIRDTETAQIGIQAALTGHLVLSSVHANDSVGVIFRLIDLGVEPFLVASALIGVVSQRMVRRVCPYCSRLTGVSSEEQIAYEEEMKETKAEFLHGSGCNFCANTGYMGRSAIFEVMTVTETIKRMILSNASPEDIRNEAAKEGTISLWRDGMMKVRQGITTPFEVMRNVYSIG